MDVVISLKRRKMSSGYRAPARYLYSLLRELPNKDCGSEKTYGYFEKRTGTSLTSKNVRILREKSCGMVHRIPWMYRDCLRLSSRLVYYPPVNVMLPMIWRSTDRKVGPISPHPLHRVCIALTALCLSSIHIKRGLSSILATMQCSEGP